MVERNWAGNVAYRCRSVERPASIAALADVVSRAGRVRVVGTRHSFNEIADSDVLVSLADLPEDIVVDFAAGTVEFNPAITYGRLSVALQDHGAALHNLASLPHISVAGAVATATHGSGNRSGNLATAVRAIEIVRSDGELVRLEPPDADFAGAVVGLGALGAVVRMQLAIEPAYDVVQHVFEDLPWGALASNFDAVTGAGDSVSVFTTYAGEHAEQVWVKRRQPSHAATLDLSGGLFGARPAIVDMHPIAGLSAESCTPQLGVPGRWSDRLPHFKMGFTPSSGDELQSELFVERRDAVAGIEALRRLAPELAPVLLVSEIRTVAADDLWMSPENGRDTVAFHFTWRRDPAVVEPVLRRVEETLQPFEPRPHWGKLFTLDATALAERYPRRSAFADLVERFDPRGAFRNPWFERTILAR